MGARKWDGAVAWTDLAGVPFLVWDADGRLLSGGGFDDGGMGCPDEAVLRRWREDPGIGRLGEEARRVIREACVGRGIWEKAGRWYEGPILPMTLPGGDRGALFVGEEVSGRREIQKALGDREELLSTLIRTSPDGVLVLDAAGRWVQANTVITRFFGLEEISWRGKRGDEVAPLVDPCFAEVLRTGAALDDRVLTRGEVVRTEERVPLPDGTVRCFDTFRAPLRHSDGTLRGLVILGRDVTEHRRMEEQARCRAREIEAILAALPDAFFLVGSDDTVLEAHAGADFPLFAPPEDLVGKRYDAVPNFPGNLGEEARRTMDQVRQGGGIARFEYALEGDGAPRHMEARCFPVGKERVGVLLRNLTALRSAENELALAEKIIESAQEGIAVTDAAGTIQTVNAAFSRITGYSRSEALGRNPRILKSQHHDASFYRDLWQALLSRGKWEGEIWNRRKNGEVYPEWLTINAIRNDRGQVLHYVSVFSDISQLKAQEAQIAHQAYHDRLTGLPNRFLFLDRLSVEIAQARRNTGAVGVLFLDLDRFKSVNDSLGHVVGDRVLVEMGRRIRNLAREGETVSHTGGDEYALLVPDPEGPKDLARIAATVLETLKDPVDAGGYMVYLSSSVGIALFPDDGQTPLEITGAADRAMYRAKAAGGDTYFFHTDEMNQAATRRFSLEAGLRRAVARQDFCVFYQPQVHARTGAFFGVEALVRWRGEDGRLISPGDFIPLAEETGLIVPLGEWVLRTACAQAREWLDGGFGPLEMSVNISAVQLYRSSLWDTVAEQVEAFHLPRGTLALEITENTILQDRDRATATFRELKKLGVNLYIDDFGTGYSSLSYLRDFAIDGLKVDKSFVDGLPDRGRNDALIRGILAIARGLGLRTVVEGVETQAQAAALREMEGELLFQGYLHGRPVPPEALRPLLLRRRVDLF